MSCAILIPLLRNAGFKEYNLRLFHIISCKYANTTTQFYNMRQSSLSNFHSTTQNFSSKPSLHINDDHNDSLIVKIAKKIPFINVNKQRMNVVGLVLYESLADRIPYTAFSEEFSLPDTFYSWFCITELHVWLLAVRCMSEGEDGQFARNRLIEAMWSDVEQRVKKLGVGNTPLIRKQVKELSEQFQAALIGYDEGLMTDDVTLAGALWRRMYQMGDIDLDHLGILIKYIRRQVICLDNIPTNQLFSTKPLTWDFNRTK